MKAMILAAGFGKRLKPLTDDIPKPLLKVGNQSLIERNIRSLLNYGFDEIVINVSYLGNMIT
jgi:MurNAc alpha-1-phosphate uridylyltransferase